MDNLKLFKKRQRKEVKRNKKRKIFRTLSNKTKAKLDEQKRLYKAIYDNKLRKGELTLSSDGKVQIAKQNTESAPEVLGNT